MSLLLGAACGSKESVPRGDTRTGIPSPDQTVFPAKFNLTDHGQKRAYVTGDVGRFFDDNTRLEVETVTVTFFDATGGADGVLTSGRATADLRTREMTARNTVIVTSGTRRLATSEVTYNQRRNELSSSRAFTFTDGNRRVAGTGFKSDHSLQNLRADVIELFPPQAAISR